MVFSSTLALANINFVSVGSNQHVAYYLDQVANTGAVGTLESIIDVGQGISVGPGKFEKKE